MNASRHWARPVADILNDAEAKRAKRERMRRWGPWVRVHGRVVEDVNWRLVARMSGAPLHLVEALLARLEIFAGGNKPRGSLEGFPLAALAAHWGFAADEQLGRIYAALEHPDIGWIEQDFIVNFCERNPETADPDAKERMRRMRARRKDGEAGAVTRNSRNVTTRSDQNSEKESALSEGGREASPFPQASAAPIAPVPAIHRNSGESGDNIFGDPELWLGTKGKKIVTERCPVLPDNASHMIEGWRKEMRDDIKALADILHHADLLGLTGGKFTDRVRSEISRRRFAANGPALPFRPMIRREGS